MGQGASPAANDFPGYALRSAAAVCKRLDVESNPSRISVGSAYCNLSLPCPASDTVDCPAPTVRLSARPTAITAGGSSTLSWSSTNASSCSAGWTGSSATSGSASVSPGSTTTYTITCSGYFGGSASASATVIVYPTVHLAASSPVNYGSRTTLSWYGADLSRCYGSGGWSGSLPTYSGGRSESPAHDTSYTITCYSPDGRSTSASASVKVGLYVAFSVGGWKRSTRGYYTNYECAYQWQSGGSDGKGHQIYGGKVYSPWPYDSWWCKLNDTRPSTPYTGYRGNGDLNVETRYDLPMPGHYFSTQTGYYSITQNYPSYCPGSPSLRTSGYPKNYDGNRGYSIPDCSTYKYNTSYNCADGSHQYTVCGGYYVVYGGSSATKTCFVTDDLYGSFSSTPVSAGSTINFNAGWGGNASGSGFNYNFFFRLASQAVGPISPTPGGGGGRSAPAYFWLSCNDPDGQSISTSHITYGYSNARYEY